MPPALVRLAIATAIWAVTSFANAATIDFAGYTWSVRDYGGGPGPNNWNPDNVYVDDQGLHLKITNDNEVWNCAEVTMTQDLGFGTYSFEVTGRPDQFDPNVVLGLFNYPPSPATGPDGSNEIDIEFAQWGDAKNPNRLNWTVYPPALGPKPTDKHVPMKLSNGASTHSFEWSATGVNYTSYEGYGDTISAKPFAKWNDAPKSPAKHIPQSPLRVHINFWLANGHAPIDGKPIEIVIHNFTFTPAAN